MDFTLELRGFAWLALLVTPNGTAIRAFRRSQKMSLRQLACEADRDPGFVSKLERGQTGASSDTLRRIAAVLGIPVAAINREEQP